MPEIFISYKREKRERALQLAEALAIRGYDDVWWDIKLLPGDRFSDEIATVIKKSRVAIVLWSKNAVTSDFVRAEASLALERKILIPARLDDCELPLPFNGYHTLDLQQWNGSVDDPVLEPLIMAVEKKLGQRSSSSQSPIEVRESLTQPKEEVVYWNSICDKVPQTAEEYKAYLSNYGNTAIFSDLAKIRIKKLKAQKGLFHWERLRAFVAGIPALATVLSTLIAGVTFYLIYFQNFNPIVKISTKKHNTVPPIALIENEVPMPEKIPDIELVNIPKGCFKMGSTEYGDEEPVHEVCVDNFLMGKYEVTQGEWYAIMEENPSEFKKGDNYPVETVSWYKVQSFIKKLNDASGKKFRLPTEAEWEYACRGAKKDEKYCGGNNVDTLAWYFPNSGNSTHPVTSKEKKPNAFNLYNMSGNVWEWCEDWYGKDYYSTSPSNNPKGPSAGSDRVIRGGSWFDNARFVR